MSPKRRPSSFQSPQSTSSTRSNPQRGTTNATSSTSSVPINVTILPHPSAVFPSQRTTTSTDRADLDPNGSLSSAYPYASSQGAGSPGHQQSSAIPTPTQSNTFGNVTHGAQPSSSLPFAGMGSPNFTDGHFPQSTRRRKGNAAMQSFPSLPVAYAPFAAPPGNTATPGPHVYPPYLGGSSLPSGGYSNNDVNLAVHQDANAIAGNSQQQLSPFTLSVGASYQQTSNAMDYSASSTFTSSTSENMAVFGFDLPSISVEDTPPSFDRVVHNTFGAASALPPKEDFTEEHPILTSPATTSTRNPLSVNTAIPVFLVAEHTPNSHSSSQADPFSGPDDDMSDEEEGKSPAPVCEKPSKRKRIRKPVERQRARPFEDRYRGGLRGSFDALGDALKGLPEEIRPNDFKGKDNAFKPKKGQVLDGSLYVVRTINDVYTELQQARARETQLHREVERLRLHLENLNVDNKSFSVSAVAQGYSAHMTAQ